MISIRLYTIIVLLGISMFACTVPKQETQEKKKKYKMKSMTVLSKKYPLYALEEELERLNSKDTLWLVEYHEYDTMGNVIITKTRDMGSVDGYNRYRFDYKGKLIEKYYSLTEQDTAYMSRWTYYYNDKDELVLELFQDMHNWTSPTIYTYDENGHLTQRQTNGGITKFEYDGDRLIAEVNESDSIVYAYDRFDRVVGSRKYMKAHPTYLWLELYFYDSRGNKVREITQDFEGNRDSTSWDYNERDLVAFRYRGGDTLIYRYEYY